MRTGGANRPFHPPPPPPHKMIQEEGGGVRSYFKKKNYRPEKVPKGYGDGWGWSSNQKKNIGGGGEEYGYFINLTSYKSTRTKGYL